MVIKDPYFYADFKNVNLPKWQVISKELFSEEKNYHTSP
jgi:hypothetical protein